MIRLENVTKQFRVKGRIKTVLDSVTVEFPTGVAVGLFGRNGAGKSTTLRMIAGTVDPTRGRIVTDGNISFQVGYSGSFHPELSGLQNTRFIARVYGVDTEELAAYVEEFAELGEHFYEPIRTYSTGMRSRLAFGVSMGMKFDTYLIDEATAAGDAAFRAKSEAVFRKRLEGAGAIFVSHSVNSVRRICTAGAVLENGKLTYYDDLEEAIAHHQRNMLVEMDDDD